MNFFTYLTQLVVDHGVEEEGFCSDSLLCTDCKVSVYSDTFKVRNYLEPIKNYFIK